ncbi:MAG: C25 family cysteine peptidase [Bacteroidales bacterium]|nr:C25 family cysteine peptidase [Bacteroidales bacterium]MDD2322522.1 C25 family cysteine peptidase [Bacteroidales bacterium]MDD3010514.1 C25 family cysteine peptidase [Bacteroidales bacterium]MDD3961533.1 C25 family cysteine peptidase [Bacteroidales bacterium]MDY0285396.1 C25 family cysteine peptidase [Bacteroidales bacterium]
MKKHVFATLVLMLYTGFFAMSQTLTFHFNKPTVLQQGDYITVSYPDCLNGGSPGDPELPRKEQRILLPQNSTINNFEIIDIQYYKEETQGILRPAQQPIPISTPNPENSYPALNSEIYTSESQWPESPVHNHGTHFLSGHGIVTFSACPVEFFPAKKQIRYISSITLSYNTTELKSPVCRARNTAAVQKRLKKLIEDPSMLSTYTYNVPAKGTIADLLIIGSEEYLALLSDFIAFKTSVGFFVESKATEEIYSQYEGIDNQEQIRNCIRDYYENYGIEYVLLVGDADPANPSVNNIPHRGLKALDDYDIPADMYYANLDGNWDENGNGIWGQVGEGDLYAEVAIGRFCVDSPQDIAHVVHKNIMYQNEPVISDGNKVLLVGENLNNNPLTWGGTYMDEIWFGTSNHGFTTAGITDNMEVSTLYDRDGTWNPKSIRDHFNTNGLNLISHLGHSNVNYNMKMDNQALTTALFRNDGIARGYVIGYSQGCYNGSFDNRGTGGGYSGDCFAELITSMETAEVAAIANSRYGWYMPANTNASSQFYNRYFFHALFGENITEIGWANAFSKEAETSWLSDEYFRWTAYELNLFGDPSLDILTGIPEPILFALPGTIIAGTTEISFKSNAPNARIAVLQEGELIYRCFTDETGSATIQLPTAAVNGSGYDFSIIAHNRLRAIHTLEVTENSPVVICTQAEIDDSDGNGNGLAEYGENVDFTLTFMNTGDQSVSDATFTLSTAAEGIEFTGNNSSTGMLAPGETITLTHAASAEISPEIASGAIVVNVTTTQAKGWNSSFIMPIGWAKPVITKFEAIEVNADPNGRIDPGENAILRYTLINKGNTVINNLQATVNPRDIYVQCTHPTLEIEQLEAGESVELVFEVMVDATTPEGFTSYIAFSLEAERGLSLSETHFTFIGWSGVLVCDLDGNHNSAEILMNDLKIAGASSEYHTEIPEDLSSYTLIFLSLGVFPDYHTLTFEEGEALAEYLLQGGKLYIESGSFWYFNDETPLHALMHIHSEIGNGWIYGNEDLTGVEGTLGEGMTFGYIGDNLRIDHLEPLDPSYLVFTSEPHTFGAMAAQETAEYKTIASTFEWSGLVPANEESSTITLMENILAFFDITAVRPPEIHIGNDTLLCMNQQLILDAGDGFTNYLWSNGATTQQIVVDTSGFMPMENTISVEVVNEYGYKAGDEIRVIFTDCTGIKEANNVNFEVYPNPANDRINIVFHTNNKTPLEISMHNLSGKKAFSNTYSGGMHCAVDVSEFQPGLYLLTVATKDGISKRKIIIQ